MTPLAAPTAFPVQPPPLPKPRFALAPVSLGVLAVCTALHLLYVSLRLLTHTPLLAMQDVGVFALGFLLSMGLATLAWRLDSRKRAGNLVFCCLLLLFTMSRVFEAIALASMPHRQATAPATRPRAIPISHANPDRDAPAPVLPNADAAAREAARRDAQQVMAVTERIRVAYQAKMEAYNRAATALQADGGWGVVGLDSRAAIARRRSFVKACIDTNAVLIQDCRTLQGRLHAELLQVVPEARAQQEVAAVMASFDQPLVLKARDCEGRFASSLDGLLILYDAEFSRWHLGTDQRVMFDDVTAVARQRYWAQRLNDAIKEERGIMQEMAARKKARSGGSESTVAAAGEAAAR